MRKWGHGKDVTYGEDVIRGEDVSLGMDNGWEKVGPWKSRAWGEDGVGENVGCEPYQHNHVR